MSGTLNTYGNVQNNYGHNIASFNAHTNAYGTYSGKSTYYTTQYIDMYMPYTTYEQQALFYAKEKNNDKIN